MNRLTGNLKIVNRSNFFDQERSKKKIKEYGLYMEAMQMLGNNYVRYWKYSKGVQYGFEGLGGRNSMGIDKVKNRKTDLARARSRIMDLGRTNFTYLDRFMTLTFRSDIKDLKVANKEFNKFIMRLRDYSKSNRNFKYLCVVEFQDLNRDDVIHYHIMTDLNYTPKAILEKIWRNGWVRINRMNKKNEFIDDVGKYLIGYLAKSKNKKCNKKDLLIARKSYFSSRGLKLDKKLIGKKCVEVKEKLKLFKEDGTPNKTVADYGLYDVPTGKKDKKGKDELQKCLRIDFILDSKYKKRKKIMVPSLKDLGFC